MTPEFEKFSAGGQIIGHFLRKAGFHRAAEALERFGDRAAMRIRSGAHRIGNILDWTPPQPKLLEQKHLPGYENVVKPVAKKMVHHISENPEVAVFEATGIPGSTLGYLGAKESVKRFLGVKPRPALEDVLKDKFTKRLGIRDLEMKRRLQVRPPAPGHALPRTPGKILGRRPK